MASVTSQSELVQILVSILTGPSLAYRRPTIIALGEEPILFRLETSESNQERIVLEELIRYRLRYWRPVGRLWSILGDWSDRWATFNGMERWAPALLAYFACFAWDWSCLLARQMKHPSPPRSSAGPDLSQRYRACLKDVKRSRSILRKRVIELVASWAQRTGPATQAAEVKMVQFLPEERSTNVRWLAADGTEVGRSSLEDWIQQLGTSEQLAACLEELREDQQKQQSHAAAAQEMLRTISPELAAAVQAACEKHVLTGFTFCRDLAVHGLPATITFFADPGLRSGGDPLLTVRALRACEEFVLQDSAGQLYYFPPCQLAAHVDFCAAEKLWKIPHPHVRVPCHSPRWTHPYSGTLYADPLARAEMFTPACPEPMVAISPQGEKLLSARVARHTEPAATDLCLADQETAIGVLDRNAREAERGGAPNPFAMVWGLWDLVAVGLTHGAVRNESRPRIDFGGPLFYPVNVNQLAGTPLAARVIAYDPARKVI